MTCQKASPHNLCQLELHPQAKEDDEIKSWHFELLLCSNTNSSMQVAIVAINFSLHMCCMLHCSHMGFKRPDISYFTIQWRICHTIRWIRFLGCKQAPDACWMLEYTCYILSIRTNSILQDNHVDRKVHYLSSTLKTYHLKSQTFPQPRSYNTVRKYPSVELTRAVQSIT